MLYIAQILGIMCLFAHGRTTRECGKFVHQANRCDTWTLLLARRTLRSMGLLHETRKVIELEIFETLLLSPIVRGPELLGQRCCGWH